MNISDFANLDFGGGNERVFSTPRYLDAPLIADHLTNDIKRAFGIRRVDSRVFHLRSMIDYIISKVFDNESYESITHDETEYARHVFPVAPSEIIRIATLTHPSIDQLDVAAKAAQEMAHMVTNVMAERGIAMEASFDMSPGTLTFFEREATLAHPQSKLVTLRAEGDSSIVLERYETPFSTHIAMSDAYVLLVHAEHGTVRVATYDMYLSILDIARVRARALLACDLLHPDTKLKGRIFAQWEWQEDWIDEFENEGFAFAKQTEALNKTRLGWESDPETRVGGAYEKMWDKLSDKLYKVLKSARKTRQRVAQARADYEAYANGASILELAELFGLQKSIGYPFIDSARGGLAAAHEAKKDLNIRMEDAIALRNEWRSMFIEGYLAREKRWPQMVFGDSARSTPLCKWYTAGYTNVSANDIEPQWWEGVVFLKNFEYDEFDNYLDLMDDKALSYNRSEADAYWDSSIKVNSDRRLLLEIMSRENFVYRVILEQVEDGAIPYDWKIVCIYPKEKELKADARMFCMMVMEMRTIFNGSEANIARHIFPYIAAQTMTRSKDEIHRLFHKFTQPRETDTELHLFLECDLSRWNLRWRARVVDLVGQDLNMLFGLKNTFTAAHSFFTESVVMVRTPRLRPTGVDEREPTDSELLYRKWLGGFEGIQQKLWTLCTYAMIQRALRGQGVSYLLIGQGDNQILSIVAPRDATSSLAHQYSALNERITKRLERFCDEVGQELKPEECLHSRTVITYSKEVWVRGVVYPLSVKFFSRIGARTNDEVPTLCAEIAGLHAAGVAAADACFHPIQIYIGVCYLHALELITRCNENHPCFVNVDTKTHRRLKRLTINDICRTLIWPAALGGLPISHLWSYIHRGTADSLSEQLAVFFRFCRASPAIAPLYAYYVSEKFLAVPDDALSLILAPYSLPLRSIASAKTSISTLIRRYVNNVAKNRDFKGLLNTNQQQATNALLAELTTMTPMYPLIAREVYDNSSSAEVEKLEKMFIMTQTIQKAARKAQISVRDIINSTSGTEFVERIRCCIECADRAEVVTTPLRHFINEPARLRRYWEVVCSRLEGVTSVASAWFDVDMTDAPSRVSGVKILAMPSVDPLHTIGDFEPYLGARTRIERSTYGYRLIGDSRSVTALKRLRILANLPGTGPKFRAMIQQVAMTRGAIDEDLAILAGGVSSSRFDHRYHARDDERGSYVVGPYNLSTHCVIYTEEIDGITGSLNDYPLMFQEFFTDAIGCLVSVRSPTHTSSSYTELTIMISAEDFPILPILAVEVTGGSTADIAKQICTSRLVYDPNVWRYDLVGSVARRNILPEVDVESIASLTLARAAIRAVFMASLPTHFASSEVFDAVMTKSRPFDFDLPTIRNIGGMDIIAVAVNAMCNSVAERYLVELALQVNVGRRELYIRRYSTYLAQRIVPLLDNVQLRDDELVVLCQINVAAMIDDRAFTPTRRLAYLIATYARRELKNLHLNDYEQYIFASDHGSTASYLHLAAVARGIVSSVENGTLPAEAARVARSVLFDDVIRETSEGNRLSKIQRLALSLIGERVWTTRSRAIFRLVANGALLSIIKRDHQVAIRVARTLVAPYYESTLVRTESPNAVRVRPFSFNRLTDDAREQVIWCAMLSISNSWMWYGLPVDGSTSYWLWLDVLRIVNNRQAVLVGVGNAFAARAALENGCTRIHGVDRVANYEIRKLRGGAYPRALIRHADRDSFHWSATTFSLDESERHGFMFDEAYQVVNAEALIIIDIQPFPTIEQLHRLARTSGTERELLFRRMTTSVDWRFELSQLTKYFVLRRVWIFRAHDAVQLFVLTNTHKGVDILRPRLTFSEISERYCCNEIVLSRTTQQNIANGTFGRLAVELSGPVRTIEQRRDLLFTLRNLIGRGNTSDKYVVWTTTLHHIWILEWWVERDRSFLHLTTAYTSATTTIMTVQGIPLEIGVTDVFKCAIARYVPLILALAYHGCL